MKTGTETVRIRTIGFVVALVLGTPGYGQVTTRIVGAGADLQVVWGNAELTRDASIVDGDSIRTDASSFAEVALGPGARMFLGANTAVTIGTADLILTIQLDAGTARVATQFEQVRVQTAAGDFLTAEIPAEVRFEAILGGVAVQVLAGGITGDSIDTSAVVFRSPDARPARVYRAGSTDGFQQTAPTYPGWYPNVYVPVPGAPYVNVPPFPRP